MKHQKAGPRRTPSAGLYNRIRFQEFVSIPIGIPLAASADYTRDMRRSLVAIALQAGAVAYAQTPPPAPTRSGMAITVTNPQRGTAHALVRRGRRPLIVLATLSGTPCEEPR
jgi:hypothetical protein